MKQIKKLLIICLMLCSTGFAAKNDQEKVKIKKAFEKLSHDSLINCLRFLEPKEIAQLERTSKDFKKASEKVYPNIPLKTAHDIMQEKIIFTNIKGRHVLRLYNHVKNLKEKISSSKIKKAKDEIIANTYTLAIATKNKKVREKLEDEYKNRRAKHKTPWLFDMTFKWAGQHNFLNNPEQALDIITTLYTLYPNIDFLRLYFQIKNKNDDEPLTIKIKEGYSTKEIAILTGNIAVLLAKTYILALQTKNESIQNKLIDTALSWLKKIKDTEEDSENIQYIYIQLCKFITKHNLLQTAETAQKFVDLLQELPAEHRGNTLAEIQDKSRNTIPMIKLMLNSPEFMQKIPKELIGQTLVNAAYAGLEDITLQILDNAKLIRDIPKDCKGSAFLEAIQSDIKEAPLKMLQIPNFFYGEDYYGKADALRRAAEKDDFYLIVKKMFDTEQFIHDIEHYQKVHALYAAIGTENIQTIELILERVTFTTNELNYAQERTTNDEIYNIIQDKKLAYFKKTTP